VRQVGNYPLWVGTARDARDLRGVLAAGIEVIVDLAVDEPPISVTRELVYLRFPLVDGGGNPPWLLLAAGSAIDGLVRLKVPTLIACSGGMSRSPAIASLGLCFATDQRAPDMVLRQVQRGTPSDIHPALWNDIMRCVATESEWVYDGPR
jgi:hypothetical protein